MIIKIRANFLGFDFLIDFTNHRKKGHNITVKNYSLYPVMQVTGENYLHILNAVNLLKLLGNRHAFKTFCKSYCTQYNYIDVQFLLVNEENHHDIHSYRLEWNSEGIIREVQDGVEYAVKEPFVPSVSYLFLDYFKMLFCFNLDSEDNIEELYVGFKRALQLKPFTVNFLFPFLKQYGIDEIREFYFKEGELYVKYGQSLDYKFKDELIDVRIICSLSWVVYYALIKSGTLILNNLDTYLNVEATEKFVYLVNNANNIWGMNNLQMLFSADYRSNQLSDVQIIKNQKIKDVNITSWQNSTQQW